MLPQILFRMEANGVLDHLIDAGGILEHIRTGEIRERRADDNLISCPVRPPIIETWNDRSPGETRKTGCGSQGSSRYSEKWREHASLRPAIDIRGIPDDLIMP